MRFSILLGLILFFNFYVHAQTANWQQRVDVRIDVQLNDTARTLEGFERLNYVNRSPDTLRFLWFHLWPNAL